MRNLFALLVVVMALAADLLQAAEEKPAAAKPGFVLVVHAGAGNIPRDLPAAIRERYLQGLAAALRAGTESLRAGGTAVDAVELAVRCMEDNGLFNAGKGAVRNSQDVCELDAAIMDGKTLGCGGVAGVSTAKNPVALARLVMEKTPHVLLAGRGADEFAAEMKAETVKPEYFVSKSLRQAAKGDAAPEDKPETEPTLRKGTVGALALDRQGNLAAATSTGGLVGKHPGRVGDSPLIGAGTYADNAACAVSCSGIGEEFIRRAVAYDLKALMVYKGLKLAEAARQIIRDKLKAGDGGLIALGKDGAAVVEYNTTGMFFGIADSTGRFETGSRKEK